MKEMALFGGSFIFVFALSFQHQNIYRRRCWYAATNAACIAGLNLFVVKLGGQASMPEMIKFIAGQPPGTLLAMWLDERKSATSEKSKQQPQQAVAWQSNSREPRSHRESVH